MPSQAISALRTIAPPVAIATWSRAAPPAGCPAASIISVRIPTDWRNVTPFHGTLADVSFPCDRCHRRDGRTGERGRRRPSGGDDDRRARPADGDDGAEYPGPSVEGVGAAAGGPRADGVLRG